MQGDAGSMGVGQQIGADVTGAADRALGLVGEQVEHINRGGGRATQIDAFLGAKPLQRGGETVGESGDGRDGFHLRIADIIR